MNKKGITKLSIILASPLIIGVIVAGIFRFDLTKYEWISLITPCVSTFVTIFLGYLVFFQNKNHEKQEQLYHEEQRKNREQDLLVKANPSVIVKEINEFSLFTGASFIGDKDYVNRLTDSKIEKTVAGFNCNFGLDLIFNLPNGNAVDRITVMKANLSCTKGDFVSDDYQELFEKSYSNNMPDETTSNLKVDENGNICSYLGLHSLKDEKKDIEELEKFDQENNKLISFMSDSENIWHLTVYYDASNMYNVRVKYSTNISFKIMNIKNMSSYLFADIKLLDTCTWIKKGAHVINSNI